VSAARLRRRALYVPAALLLLAGALLSPADADAKRPRKKPAKAKAAPANFDTKLPVLGTKLADFPAGPAKAIADTGCLACHSADMSVQQRLTEKQWTAEVTKMTGWGADVPQEKRDELVQYLVKNFGPDGPRYEPVTTRPVGR
jgi:cytochrome c5